MVGEATQSRRLQNAQAEASSHPAPGAAQPGKAAPSAAGGRGGGKGAARGGAGRGGGGGAKLAGKRGRAARALVDSSSEEEGAPVQRHKASSGWGQAGHAHDALYICQDMQCTLASPCAHLPPQSTALPTCPVALTAATTRTTCPPLPPPPPHTHRVHPQHDTGDLPFLRSPKAKRSQRSRAPRKGCLPPTGPSDEGEGSFGAGAGPELTPAGEWV
jgi:hypothetical protein